MITRRQESTLFNAVIERLTQSEITAMNDRSSPVLKSNDFRSLLGGTPVRINSANQEHAVIKPAAKDEMHILGRFFRLAYVVSSCQIQAGKQPDSTDAVDRLVIFEYAWILLERLEFRKARPEALLQISELLLNWCSTVQLLEQIQLLHGFRYRIYLCAGKLEDAKSSADYESEIAILTKSTRQLELLITTAIGRGVFGCLGDPHFMSDLAMWADDRFVFEIQSDYFDFLVQLVRFIKSRVHSEPDVDSGFEELVRIMSRPGLIRHIKRSPFRTAVPFAWPHVRDVHGLDEFGFHQTWSACHPLWSFLAEWHVHKLLLNGQFDTALCWIPYLNQSGVSAFQNLYFHVSAILFSGKFRESRVLMLEWRKYQPQNPMEDFTLRIMELRIHWNKTECDFLSARIEALRKYAERHHHEPGFRDFYGLFVRLLSCLSRSWFDFAQFKERHEQDLERLKRAQAQEYDDPVFAYEPCWIFFDQKRFEVPVRGPY
ncbi:MAG: hypothetical protein ACK5CT_11285 [Bacteroidota bacterium]